MRKSTNKQKVNPWAKEEIINKIRKHFEMLNNENSKGQNLQTATKALLSYKCITLYVYIRKEEKFKINKLSLKKLRKKANQNTKYIEDGNKNQKSRNVY